MLFQFKALKVVFFGFASFAFLSCAGMARLFDRPQNRLDDLLRQERGGDEARVGRRDGL